MQLTTQQTAFIEALINTTSHLALVARAGCGKSSTILAGVAAILEKMPGAEILICAYNKTIELEMTEKLKEAGHSWKQVRASTVHGLGYGLFKYLNPKLDEDKVYNLIKAQNDPEYQLYKQQIGALVRYAKQAGVGFFPDQPIGDVGTWHALADHFDVNGLDDTSEADLVVECAQKIYRLSLAQSDIIDFDDMILFPLVKNMRVKFQKDFVFVDEAQDLSRARQALIRKFVKGRMIVVGDDRQAIYGFTGADAAALPNMINQLGATVLPLTATWRCPRSVVRLAQRIVPDIEAREDAPEGEVVHIPNLPPDISRTDAILCRNTAPLISIAYQLIRAGKPCLVEGRAIGTGLKNLAQRWKVKTIDALLNRLDEYEAREVQKALAKGSEAKAEEAKDRCETLRQICQSCLGKGLQNVSDVVAFIDTMFKDDAHKAGVTVLATYHRSKGREWDRVFLFEHADRCPSKAARQAWQVAQEDNLAYVAFTRAKQTLAFVN